MCNNCFQGMYLLHEKDTFNAYLDSFVPKPRPNKRKILVTPSIVAQQKQLAGQLQQEEQAQGAGQQQTQ